MAPSTATGAPTRAKSQSSAGKPAKSSKHSSDKQQQIAYRDVIDKLDLSGLGGGFHHSGPFDAAISAQKNGRHAPIGAFSSSALDGNYGSNGRRPGGGDGVSARAKATMAAMQNGPGVDGNPALHPSPSSENLLGGSGSSGHGNGDGSRPGNERRNSESSVTLGYPIAEMTEKERQYFETFGVGPEAYLDYGNSSYARKAPRASVAPSPAGSTTSFPHYPGSQTPPLPGSTQRPTLSVGKMTRADRTASIWDIEATLREGRPVGAAPPPPMPVIPDRFLSPQNLSPPQAGDSSGSASGSGVKRSKSLLARMRTKKGAMISSPSPQSSPEASFTNGQFSTVPGAAPLPYDGYQGMPPLPSGKSDYDGKEDPFDNSAAVVSGASPDVGYRGRPGMSERRSTSPVEQKLAHNYLQPTTSEPSHNRGGSPGHSPITRRSPAPPSPLGLPEAGDDGKDPFSSSMGRGASSSSRSGGGGEGSTGRTYGLGLKSSMSRSAKNADLARESATAAILAESSSKESGISKSTSSSSDSSAFANNSSRMGSHSANASLGYAYGYSGDESAFTTASDRTTTPDRSGLAESTSSIRTSGGGGPFGFGRPRGSSASDALDTRSPSEGKLSRKPSLASRLLRGKNKKST